MSSSENWVPCSLVVGPTAGIEVGYFPAAPIKGAREELREGEVVQWNP